MRLRPVYSVGRTDGRILDHPDPLELDRLLPGGGPWVVELGYGKGRFLLEQARSHPERRFLGVEVVSKYYKMLTRRARHRGVGNLLNIRGEALYLLSTLLPRGFADHLHVYFPDPWPKAKHHRRRLFDPETVDLVLGVLAPGGRLSFATDFLEYGHLVHELLEGYPGFEVEPVHGLWPGGARTNYEAKYEREGRPILRLRGRLETGTEPVPALHPEGRDGILAACAAKGKDDVAAP